MDIFLIRIECENRLRFFCFRFSTLPNAEFRTYPFLLFSSLSLSLGGGDFDSRFASIRNECEWCTVCARVKRILKSRNKLQMNYMNCVAYAAHTTHK